MATSWAAFRRTVLATTSSLVAVAVIYRIAMAVAPALWQVLEAINHLALTAKI